MAHGEIELREVFRILRRRLWMLILLPVVTAVTAWLVSAYVLQPVYSASARLWVLSQDPGQMSYNDVLLNRDLTKTYAEVAKSRSVLADALERVKPTSLSVEALQSKLTVSPVRDTEILLFSVEYTDPNLAASLVDAVAVSFQTRIRTVMNVENVIVVDRAQVPTTPVKPRTNLNIALAGILGIVGASGLVLLLEYLDTSVKTASDVERYIGLPVLGSIPVIDLHRLKPPKRWISTRTNSGRTVVDR